MIQSMTGYGKATATFGDKKIYVEIKSLNSKAMDLSTRIAPLYREKEMEIRNLISKTLERGKVDVNLWIEKEAAEAATPINTALLQNYYQQIKTISETCNIPLPEDWFATLLRMPDVLTRVDIQELTEEEWNTVRKSVEEALQHVVDFRKQEGAALEKSLSIDYDKNRLEQELIYYIEKLDINEEKQRLSNHLKYFRETMAGGHGQGKKLGFIAQEMGREINTTGSKSNHAEMQNIVVQMKDELEQIKEQVLNVM